MFGSKIRSWMENHIVRPRKKGNKNKNGSSSSNNSSVPTTNFNTQSGYLGPSYSLYNADSITGQGTMAVIGNGTNSVPSPARRHEVSPIQCHKSSRFGWHSPTHGGNNKNLMSPKSEHYMKMQHPTDNFKTVVNNSNNLIKSEQAIENNIKGRNQDNSHNNMYNNNNSNINNIQQYNNSLTKTLGDERNHKMHSSNVEMLKNKCFSNQQNIMDQEERYHQQQQQQQQQKQQNHHHHHQHYHHHQKEQRNIRNNKNQIESEEHNNKILSYKTSDKEHLLIRNKFENIESSINSSVECVHSIQSSDKKHFKRITEFESNNSTSHQNKSNFQNNNTDIKNHRKHHEHNSDNIANTTSTKTSSFAKTYKKIFSSSSSASTNDRNGKSNPKINEGNYDQINANISPHYYQAIDNGYYGNNNNNNVDGSTIKTSTGQKSTKEKIKKSERKQLTESGYYEMLCDTGNFQHNSLNQHATKTAHQATTSHTSKSRNSVYEMNRVQPNSYLVMGSTNLHYRNHGRQNNTIGPSQTSQPNSNHPLAHVINSLSSPESAYSTGYSTDGTSPGTTYTPPEYYINMRTGTHYFPKNANSLGVELSRQKFGLNKIEEVMLTHQHRRTESYDLNQIKITSHMELLDEQQFRSKESLQKQHLEHMQNFEKQNQNKNGAQQLNNSLSVNYRGFESPSPRQRSRIRTNPWYSTPESSFSASSSHLIKKSDLDTSSSSSGIKSNSDIRASIVEDEKSKESSEVSDDETESSSTEVEVDLSKRMSSRGTLKQNDETTIEIARPLSTDQVFNPIDFHNKNQVIRNRSFKGDNYSQHALQQESDEDTTLNEMMGKFDESYIYEKETDILSSNDSDPTHCNSDIDTGQDAGDEYDTEDLLDIDFIDTGSIQEIVEKSEKYKNTGNCSYHNFNTERRMSRNRRRSHKRNEEILVNTSSSGKRKKRLLKTRKKSCESKERSASPLKSRRESRSVGGTPVCLRRRISSREKKNEVKLSPLVHQQRSNSLTFTEVHTVREKYIAIAESEKMLLKADLEADIKYKQLIHEAESILVSMKANAIIVPRETPVASPSRRILNPPANKRVEMLRQCEVDIKREMQKQQQQQHMTQTSSETTSTSEHLINKRLELLRHEFNSCNSVPTSPKCGRLSPRKTHLTNFINQVASSDIAWRNPNSNKNRSNEHLSSDELPHINTRTNRHVNRESSSPPPPPPSQPPPPPPRRFLSEKTTHICSTLSMSNSEEDIKSMESISYSIKSSSKKSMIDIKDEQNNQLSKESVTNNGNCNFPSSDFMTKSPLSINKQPLISFKSVDMGNKIIEMGGYCPQSEPLKRKIYKGSSSFERIKKSLDIESEIPKQNMLNKINSIRRDRHIPSNQSSTQDINTNFKNLKISNNNINNNNNNNDQNQQDQSAYQSNDEDSVSIVSNLSVKQQLILNTIEDLKKNLEDQCVELTAQFDS